MTTPAHAAARVQEVTGHLDDQTFAIRIDLVEPAWDYAFRDLEGFSEVGTRLGEEQWLLTGYDTRITTETDTVDFPTSRFTFRFHATRHLDYYVYRIFLPIMIIVLVSWFAFFLRDYGKRVDVAGANLLLFIAFNFTISNDPSGAPAAASRTFETARRHEIHFMARGIYTAGYAAFFLSDREAGC